MSSAAMSLLHRCRYPHASALDFLYFLAHFPHQQSKRQCHASGWGYMSHEGLPKTMAPAYRFAPTPFSFLFVLANGLMTLRFQPVQAGKLKTHTHTHIHTWRKVKMKIHRA